MRNIFFGRDGLIRVGWRITTFLFSFLIIASALIFAASVLLSQIPFGESATRYFPLVLPFALSALAAILLGCAFGRLFEDLSFEAFGLTTRGAWLRSLGLGSVIGSVAIASAVLISVMGGGMAVTLNRESTLASVLTTLSTTLIIFLVGALSEETLFRGYMLQTSVRSGNFVLGITLTSLLFAFAHNNNPGANSISLFNTTLAGGWFAYAYLKTRDLWFPLGMHFTWNWLQGPVFGINVSGISEFSPAPLLRTTDHGPAYLTGGGYGVEAGFACTIAIMISIGLIYFLPLERRENDSLTRSGS